MPKLLKLNIQKQFQMPGETNDKNNTLHPIVAIRTCTYRIVDSGLKMN